MKTKTKKILIISTVSVLVFALIMSALYMFVISPLLVKADVSGIDTVAEMTKFAENAETVDFDTDSGMLYVNNEVIVYAKATATAEELATLFKSFDAVADDAMADIGIYKLTLKSAKSYDELEDIVDDIKDSKLVDDAYLNLVSKIEADAKDKKDDFDYEDPQIPNDYWNGDDWDVEVPRNENWGMEAINAPGAWGYLDRIKEVNVGLIDSMPDTEHEDLTVENSSYVFIDTKTGKHSINTYKITADKHGTHVAGTINAEWDNDEIGVSGVMGGKGKLYHSAYAYQTDGTVNGGYATSYAYLMSIKALVDQDVQVINISQHTSRLIGFAASHGNKNAINYLTEQAEATERGLLRLIESRRAEGKPDFLLCVSAGNSNSIRYFKDDEAVYGYREALSIEESFRFSAELPGEEGGSLALYNNFLSLIDDKEVKGRIIVVGAVGVDYKTSSTEETKYYYADFSNVGDRVDIVAPGVGVYSTVPKSVNAQKYDRYDGTSMAAPHVAGVAGLVFGANPTLTGPEVKQILISSSVGRYYHGEYYSGLLNANNAVVNSLKTLEVPVEHVVKPETASGMDLCFVVDTTGSMGDDIDDAKANMEKILSNLAEKSKNYRVALIDYRDFPDRSNYDDDYACKVQLQFTENNSQIKNAINALELGSGGDEEETVLSALMESVKLDWRPSAKKVIIILGDAAPLDPEPYTNYTFDDVLAALYNAEIGIDYDDSDDRVIGDAEDSIISVYSIGTDASDDASDFFASISDSTGGSYVDVDDASQVGDAIVESINKIEIIETVDADTDFGTDFAGKTINLYSDGEYLFSFEADDEGCFELKNMEPGEYTWTSTGLNSSGTIEIDKSSAEILVSQEYGFTALAKRLNENKIAVAIIVVLFIIICIVTPIIIRVVLVAVKKKKLEKAERIANTPVAAPVAPPVNTVAPTVTATSIPVNPPPIARPVVPVGEARICSVCGEADYSKSKFCMNCGTKFETEQSPTETAPASAVVEEKPAEPIKQETTPQIPKDKYICPNCGNLCHINARFCIKCGTPNNNGK